MEALGVPKSNDSGISHHSPHPSALWPVWSNHWGGKISRKGEMEIFIKKGKPNLKHIEGKKKTLGVKRLKKGCVGSTTKPPAYSSGQQKASLDLYCEPIEREGRGGRADTPALVHTGRAHSPAPCTQAGLFCPLTRKH